ncbi:hypothetical protein D3C76_1546310 [compost metagenome]
MKGQGLLPQGVELIQYIDMGMLGIQAVEHLDTFRLAVGQDQCQVMLLQHIVVQV